MELLVVLFLGIGAILSATKEERQVMRKRDIMANRNVVSNYLKEKYGYGKRK